MNNFYMYPKSPKYSVYFLLFAIGLILFFAIAFTFSFREKVFQAFFEKPFSFALEEDNTPKVDLIATVDNSSRRGLVSVEGGKEAITLKWKTENDTKDCVARFWSSVKKTDPWTGTKNAKGGDYTISDNLDKGIYVYSINCSNESGDSGASITINVGAKPSYLQPHIVSFQAFDDSGKQYEVGSLNQVGQKTNLKINWSSINTETPYGVCVASGSWPTIYQNSDSSEVKETFTLERVKVYKYSLFCSNENGYDSQEISFMVR